MSMSRKGLGRGLAALIPEEEMELLRRVAREDTSSEIASSIVMVPKKVVNKAIVAPMDIADRPNLRSNKIAPQVGRISSVKNSSFAAKEEKVSESELSQSDTKRTASLKSEPVIATDLGTGKMTLDGVTANMVLVSDIEPNPYQPRRYFDVDELNDLASSLREHGLIQPLLVRPNPGGALPYQLVAGERRWRAAQIAKLEEVPAIIRDVDDQQSLELALIENVQRHDISAIDAALAYKRLAQEFHLSQELIAKRVGKSRSAVANTIRLLDLQDEARKAIEEGELTEGHGRAILLANGEGARRALLRRTLRDRLSVREVERLAREIQSVDDFSDHARQEMKTKGGAKSASVDEPLIAQAVNSLQRKLGARTHVKNTLRGGSIVIEYSTSDELRRLIDILLK